MRDVVMVEKRIQYEIDAEEALGKLKWTPEEWAEAKAAAQSNDTEHEAWDALTQAQIEEAEVTDVMVTQVTP